MNYALPTNKLFKVRRKGVDVAALTNLAALCVPARPEVVAVRDVPAAKAFEITFADTFDVREQDMLINQADVTETFRVRAVEKYLTPRLSHTYALAEGRWGTD